MMSEPVEGRMSRWSAERRMRPFAWVDAGETDGQYNAAGGAREGGEAKTDLRPKGSTRAGGPRPYLPHGRIPLRRAFHPSRQAER